MFKRLFAALGLALVASVSASTAMAWAAPYSVVTENEEPPVEPVEEMPEELEPLDETENVPSQPAREQFDLQFVAMCLQVLLLAGILVTLWAAR